MLASGGAFLLSPADSARAVAQVYTWSLLATIPLALAWVASLALARSAASTRVLVWRGALAALLVVFTVQLLPWRWVAWVLPEGLAAPLVALGRLQVGERAAPDWDATGLAVAVVLVVYVAGVVVALTALACDWLAVRRSLRDAPAVEDPGWLAALEGARGALGIRRRVALVVGDTWAVPATFGLLHPVVILPLAALRWDAPRRRALLLHELAHVGAGDLRALLAARIACAACWFHPGAWLALRRLREECELACDDRVLSAGVTRSDYAALLLEAALLVAPGAAAPAGPAGPLARAAHGATLAMAHRAGVRARVAAIADCARDIRGAGRARRSLAAALTLAVALPTGALRPAPTRHVLTTLLNDTRWEARAWAVIGLAQRADSLAIARRAARLDPSARVRAAASLALARSPVARVAPSD